MMEEGYDVFACMDSANFRRLRYLVLTLVAATDMSMHFEYVSKLSDLQQRHNQRSNQQQLYCGYHFSEEADRETIFCCTLKMAVRRLAPRFVRHAPRPHQGAGLKTGNAL